MKKHFNKFIIILILIMISITLISCKDEPIEDKLIGIYASETTSLAKIIYTNKISIEEIGENKTKFFYYYQITTNVNGNALLNRVMYGYWQIADLSSKICKLELTVIFDSNQPDSNSYTLEMPTNLESTECFLNGFVMRKINN